jgi:hypothetical protein
VDCFSRLAGRQGFDAATLTEAYNKFLPVVKVFGARAILEPETNLSENPKRLAAPGAGGDIPETGNGCLGVISTDNNPFKHRVNNPTSRDNRPD